MHTRGGAKNIRTRREVLVRSGFGVRCVPFHLSDGAPAAASSHVGPPCPAPSLRKVLPAVAWRRSQHLQGRHTPAGGDRIGCERPIHLHEGDPIGCERRPAVHGGDLNDPDAPDSHAQDAFAAAANAPVKRMDGVARVVIALVSRERCLFAVVIASMQAKAEVSAGFSALSRANRHLRGPAERLPIWPWRPVRERVRGPSHDSRPFRFRAP